MSLKPEHEPKTEKDDSESEKKESCKRRFSHTFDQIKKNKNVDNWVLYAKENTQDTIAYLLMILGIIWSFFQGFYAGILIGLVFGFYFSKEIVEAIKSYNEFIEELGHARSLILGGAILAFFIFAPGIFIGAAIMVGLKILLRAE